jgi:hypothetical protein
VEYREEPLLKVKGLLILGNMLGGKALGPRPNLAWRQGGACRRTMPSRLVIINLNNNLQVVRPLSDCDQMEGR